MRNTIGFHCGPGGNPTGIGDWMRSLNNAGIPFFLKSADHYGMLYEAHAIVLPWNAAHTLVYRLSTAGQNDGFDYDVPDYHLSPEASADRHFNRTVSKLPPEMNRALVWHEPVNEVRFEPDPADPMWGNLHPCEWFGRFGIQYATRCLQADMRCALFAWASGNPERDGWEQPAMLNFLRLCAQHPNQVAVALHEYSLDVNNILDGAPYKVGRFLLLFDVCDDYDIGRPTVLITEWGWTLNDAPAPERAVADIDTVMRDYYAAHPQIKGAGIWYLGGGWNNLANKVQRVIAPLTTHTLNTEYEGGTEPPPPDPDPEPEPGDLLRNASFEGGWYHPGGLPELQIPNEWEFGCDVVTPNPYDNNPWSRYVRPEVRVLPAEFLPEHERPLFIFDGNQTLKAFKGGGAWWGWFTQTIDIPAGDYTMTCPLFADLVKAYNGGQKVWADDPDGRDGQYRFIIGQRGGAWGSLIPGQRNDLVHDFSHAGGPLLIGLEMRCNFALLNSGVFTDAWSLTAVTTEPPPTTCPGQAREPYGRVYWVVQPSDPNRDAIYQLAAAEKRTIGPAYDDAGIGVGLTSKTAVLWNITPNRHQEFIDWYALHYPGTAVQFRYLNSNPAPPIPTPPSSDPCAGGSARTPYNRVYWVSDDPAVYALAAAEGRTVGPSYDDAGIGHGLTSKTAVLWNITPNRHQEFIDWYALHYPGTAVEFRDLTPPPAPGGFDAPVGWGGNQTGEVWPPHYFDANPIGSLYSQGRHTGADLNDNTTHGWDSDKLAPTFAIAGGRVTQAGVLGGTWGNVVVIDHGAVGPFAKICSRYGHMHDFSVQVGQQVTKGQQIGRIGNAFNQLAYHLHFDIAHGDRLITSPGDWPGADFGRVVRSYLEPRSFIRLSRPGMVWPEPRAGAVSTAVNFRTGPSASFAVYSTLAAHTAVTVLNELDNYYLVRLAGGEHGWCHKNYINLNPPPAGSARVGLHASADPGDLHGGETEFAEFRALGGKVVKVLSAHSASSINRLAAENPGAQWIVRAFLHWGGRNITPAQFYNDTIGDTQRAVSALMGAGVVAANIWIELHNEPNLVVEGWTLSWQNGTEFAAWLLDVYGRYRNVLPNVKYLYPGLSPGGNVPGVRMDAAVFLNASLNAARALDGVGVHAYWSNPFPMAQALAHVDATLTAVGGSRPYWITEASRNDRPSVAPPSQYAQEYALFVEHMRARPNVRGVTYFVASASNPYFHPECWVVNGQSRGIAAQVRQLVG